MTEQNHRSGASKLAQPVRVLAAKSENLRSSPQNVRVERKKDSQKLFPDLHTYTH